MKKQEIFDKVYRHLLFQMERVEDNDGCRYRLGKLSCAIGCLIPDDLYDEGIEQAPAYRFVVGGDPDVSDHAQKQYALCRRIGRKIGLYPSQRGLLEALQTVHDEEDPDGWESDLRRVAKNHKLNVPI